MKVILLQDIKGTGKKDQIIEVSDGFARNYLFPKKLASEANAVNLNSIENQKCAMKHKEELLKQAAAEQAKALEGKTVIISTKIGKEGRMFGSIGPKEIADALAAQHQIQADKKKIAVDSIKSLGEYSATVKLYPSISAKIKVLIKAEE